MQKLLNDNKQSSHAPPRISVRSKVSIFPFYCLVDGKYLTKAYKDREKKKYASYWPPALATCIKDGVDAPRDPQLFLNAYFFLSKATQIESKLT